MEKERTVVETTSESAGSVLPPKTRRREELQERLVRKVPGLGRGC